MKREETQEMIDRLHTMRRATRRAVLMPGERHDDGPPRGWWVLDDA